MAAAGMHTGSGSRRQRSDEIAERQGETAAAQSHFTALRPFHPLRLFCLLHMPWPQEIEASGSFWIAASPHWRFELSCLGGTARYRRAGIWWAALDGAGTEPDHDGSPMSAMMSTPQQDWHPVLGDRHQRIDLAGPEDLRAETEGLLRRCLVEGDDTITSWNASWTQEHDPFAPEQPAAAAAVRF